MGTFSEFCVILRIYVKIEYSNSYPSVSVGHGVHGDEDGAAGVKRELHPLELEALDVVCHGVLDGVDLLSHHGEDSQLDSNYNFCSQIKK